ncbi:site-2 protease family protein [Aureliella helgolandensis]|uniref:Stage IV sporulation protein FB n=1 Tax=Aureliella helgolandensis TaxID=2527968 RepID=A0A518G537_9BACT|nr:site-2 protease family protein [Aureliella helgolandensis]QDV23680.1 Stage IV sporulation protein FB [Aureliella helgolandensis]
MKIGTAGGIGVYIHWSFWMLIAFYLINETRHGGFAAGLFAVAFVLSIFACVVAHEFGHAGAAALFGIRTRDITLLPIGGVARLERMPEKPMQELVIAVAGPAVNVVIAGLLLVAILVRAETVDPAHLETMQFSYMEGLFAANVFLVLFNMLPVFPMDGGRVLRSILAMWTTHLRATEIAARIGRWMALALAIYAIYTLQFTLLLLAGFVFVAGTAELMAARVRAMGAAAQGGAPNPFGKMWPNQQAEGSWSYSGGQVQRSSQGQNDPGVIDAVSVREVRE